MHSEPQKDSLIQNSELLQMMNTYSSDENPPVEFVTHEEKNVDDKDFSLIKYLALQS